MRTLASLIAVAVLCWPPSPVAATSIRVPADQPTIQAGLQAAAPGDTVLVSCGTYLEHDLVIGSGTVLRSETGDPACVTIDARSLGRVLTSAAGNGVTRLEGLTLTGGYAPPEDANGYGGAMLLHGSVLDIRDCVFRDNRAYDSGGAICSGYDGLHIENCVFDGNSAIDGAALFLDGTPTQVVHCTFAHNRSQVWGGAVFAQVSSPTTITSCTFYDNSAAQGSGLWFVYDCDLVVENCLIAYGHGEGIYQWPGYGHPSTIAVRCSDVFGNGNGNYGGELEDQTGVNGNISADPLFCEPDNGDFRLATGSPCLPENNACGVLMGAYGSGCVAAAVGGEGPKVRAAGLSLEGNHPNPFRSSTGIVFRLDAPGPVAFSIFDPTGRCVWRSSSARPYSAGEHRLDWDGCDATGRPLPSGVYLYRIDAVEVHRGASMQLLR